MDAKPQMRVVFFASMILYLLTGYGGVRSPDAEVVFETCDALRSRGTWAVQGASAWEGFALAPGRDQRRYSIFGPLQPLMCVPVLAAVDRLSPAGWYERARISIPPSHYVGPGLRQAALREPVTNPGAHARRSVVAWIFNPVVSAIGAALVFRIATRLGVVTGGAFAASALHVAGSLAWPYAGTFFSEPLATVFVLLSLDAVLAAKGRAWPLVVGGAAIGFATLAHVSAILFFPFFAAFAWTSVEPSRRRRAMEAFLLGAMPVLASLAAFNVLRFDDPFETGRTVDAGLALRFGYGRFVPPWRGLIGLLVGAKGILLTCPAVLLGLFAWPAFHRRARALSWTIATAAAVRVLFIASRSDWHGGFSHGPRYLVPLIPLLLLPVAVWVDEALREGRYRSVVAGSVAGFVCALVTWQLVAGEVFTWFHSLRLVATAQGIDVLAGDRLYLDWSFAPIIGGLFHARPAPMLLSAWFDSARSLWIAGSAVLAIAWAACTIAIVFPAASPSLAARASR